MLFLSDFEHFLCDEWSGNGLSQGISFVVAVCLDQRKQVILYKLVLRVDGVVLVAQLACPRFCFSQVALGLADVNRNGHNLIILVLLSQDRYADRSVKTSRI